MSAALQIYYSGFDTAFFKLPPKVQSRIEAKIDDMGLRLNTFPHYRLQGIIAFACVWVIIESFTPPIWSGISFTCWRSEIGARFIAIIKTVM